MSIGQQQSARVARYNRAVVLDLVRRLGPVSKSELAERSGLAVSSVLNILSSLSRRGFIREVGLGPSTGGRPPALVELDPDAHFAIGVNIRPAWVEAVLIDLVGDIRAETTIPLQGGLDPDSVEKTVVEAVGQVSRLAQIDAGRVLGVGIGCPGPVVNSRTVVGAPGFPSWRNVELADELERLLGLPVTLENDANLGALAEYRHGHLSRENQTDSLVYLYVDNGIGAGIVIDGVLYRGVDGLAGEIGHTVVDVDGPLCICGTYGCLEAVASVGAVVRRFVAESKLAAGTTLAEKAGGDWDSVSFEAVIEAAEQGDAIALTALDEAMSYLAVGVANLSRQFRTDVIVLGGRLFQRGPMPLSRLQESLDRRPRFFGMQSGRVVLGELGNRAACVGAATLVLENFFGVAQRALDSEPLPVGLPGFEHTPVWPAEAEEALTLTPSRSEIVWAGNLEPAATRLPLGQPLEITVDVKTKGAHGDVFDAKVLLHWDRVAMFGGSWSNPKNSPMHLAESIDGRARYKVTLGSLPPGKYEFAAHVLGKNDRWVRAGSDYEPSNGRVEVLAGRAAVPTDNDRPMAETNPRKEAERREEAVVL